MKGKPIEPGCLALVVGNGESANEGRVVTVVGRAPSLYKSPNAPRNSMPRNWPPNTWVVCVSKAGRPLTGYTHDGLTHQLVSTYAAWELACPERNLIRIDDDEQPKAVDRTVVKTTPKSKPVDEVI